MKQKLLQTKNVQKNRFQALLNIFDKLSLIACSSILMLLSDKKRKTKDIFLLF